MPALPALKGVNMSRMRPEDVLERETFVLDTWKALWPKDAAAVLGKEHTAKHVNSLVHAKYGEFMRSDRIYRLRDRAIDELRTGGLHVPDPPRKFHADGTPLSTGYNGGAVPASRPAKLPKVRHRYLQPQPLMSAGRQMGESATAEFPMMITGLVPGEVGGISKVFNWLRSRGAINLTVEHAGDTYAVINVGK